MICSKHAGNPVANTFLDQSYQYNYLYFYIVSYIKGGMQAKGIWKQGPEANIWAQEEWEWGVEKAPQWGTS